MSGLQARIDALLSEVQLLRFSAYYVDRSLVGRRIGPWTIIDEGPYCGFDYDLSNVDVHRRFWCRHVTIQHYDGHRQTLYGADDKVLKMIEQAR